MQTSMRIVRRLRPLAVAAAVASALPNARTEGRETALATATRERWATPWKTPEAAIVRLPLQHAELRQRYRVDSVIGRGGFGLVHEGRDKRSDARVAIKRVCKQTTSKAKFLQEVDILRAVGGHQHVVSLRDAFETTDAYVLVTELVDGEELFDHLVEHGTFDERRAKALVRDVAHALAYLHDHGVVHGDLKPENILVGPVLNGECDNALRVKLIDFGQSFHEHVASERSRCVGSGIATIAYAAPEVLTKATTTSTGSAIDMWGLGVVLYILLCGFHPFDPENDASDAVLAERIKRGALDTTAPEWTELPAGARDLILQLLQVDPTQRLAAEQVLQHEWLTVA